MEEILQNEIKRQEYMESRYKSIDEDSTKPDTEEVTEERSEKSDKDDPELKYLEESFPIDKLKILEELGISLIVTENEKK